MLTVRPAPSGFFNKGYGPARDATGQSQTTAMNCPPKAAVSWVVAGDRKWNGSIVKD